MNWDNELNCDLGFLWEKDVLCDSGSGFLWDLKDLLNWGYLWDRELISEIELKLDEESCSGSGFLWDKISGSESALICERSWELFDLWDLNWDLNWDSGFLWDLDWIDCFCFNWEKLLLKYFSFKFLVSNAFSKNSSLLFKLVFWDPRTFPIVVFFFIVLLGFEFFTLVVELLIFFIGKDESLISYPFCFSF